MFAFTLLGTNRKKKGRNRSADAGGVRKIFDNREKHL
jgi:hypothetical protein